MSARCRCGRALEPLNPPYEGIIVSDVPKCVGCGLVAERCTCTRRQASNKGEYQIDNTVADHEEEPDAAGTD